MEVFKNIFDNLGITEFARPSLGISDILDILIVAYIIYKIIFWIKETRAWVLFKGILVIFALAAVAMLLKLNTILWILSNTISVGIRSCERHWSSWAKENSSPPSPEALKKPMIKLHNEPWMKL